MEAACQILTTSEFMPEEDLKWHALGCWISETKFEWGEVGRLGFTKEWVQSTAGDGFWGKWMWCTSSAWGMRIGSKDAKDTAFLSRMKPVLLLCLFGSWIFLDGAGFLGAKTFVEENEYGLEGVFGGLDASTLSRVDCDTRTIPSLSSSPCYGCTDGRLELCISGRNDCGWCVADGSCTSGSVAGPSEGTCSGAWIWRSSYCPTSSASLESEQAFICTDCTHGITCESGNDCGYCATDGMCYRGTSDGPSSGEDCSSSAWAWLPDDCNFPTIGALPPPSPPPPPPPSPPPPPLPSSSPFVITGGCSFQSDALENVEYVAAGATASGAPYYRDTSFSYYIFWDPSCDGVSAPARWIVTTVAPSTTASSDLDGDGSCTYQADVDSDDSSSPPLGTVNWWVVCEDSWTQVDLTLSTQVTG